LKIYYPDRFITRHVGGNSTYARKLKEGMEDHYIETGLIPSSFHPFFTLITETAFGLRRLDNSVLHYTGDTGPILPTRTPSVVTVHGVSRHLSPMSRKPTQERIWRERVKLAIRNCDRIITVSGSSADEISETFGVDRQDITVIHHGVDAHHFAKSVQLSQEFQQIIPGKYILYLGNIEPKKNLIALIRGYRQSKVQKEGIQLIIAGQPAWDYEETLIEIGVTPGVVYLGFVSDDDRIALMQNCELFILPSLYEGFGFPVLEALAAGAVVTSTRRGALSEIAGPSLEIDGVDSEAISHAIHTGLGDNNARLTVLERGWDWANQFSWPESVRKHLAVYKEVSSHGQG